MKCQIIRPEHSDLVCPAVDSHGYRCERTDEHGRNAHWVSTHTLIHAQAGNGYSCKAIERYL